MLARPAGERPKADGSSMDRVEKMITAEDAHAIVLSRTNSAPSDVCRDIFVIQSCELSARRDYWIVRANSEDFVHRGMVEKQYVGVNAYLVSSVSGNVEFVGSGQSVEGFLQDSYDAEAAGDEHYVLGPIFTRYEKTALVNLRQKLECSFQDTILLISAPQSAWITGSLGTLKNAKELLEQQDINVSIQLHPEIASAIEIDNSVSDWSAMKTELHRLIHILTHRPVLRVS